MVFPVHLTGSPWEAFIEELRREFAVSQDLARAVVRMVLALIVGGLLGYEREAERKAAGLRTHMLVCLGAAAFTTTVADDHVDDAALARLVQGVATGVGFLGAGTIIKKDSPRHVRGLTTAAGLWLTAAAGFSVGAGRPWVAVAAALLAWTVLVWMRRFEVSHTGDAPADSDAAATATPDPVAAAPSTPTSD